MRASRLLLLASLAALAAPAAAIAQPSAAADSAPLLVVSATRSSRLAADRASLDVVVEASGESPAAAAQGAERRLLNVTEVARQLGERVEGSTATPLGVTPLGVTPLGVTATARLDGFASPPPLPYVARYVVRLQPAHVDDVTGIATALLAAGARSAHPVFESSVADSVRRARYADALAEARRDADVLAAALGGRVGPVVDASTAAAPSGGDSTPSPDVAVSVTVTVRYRLVKP